MAAFCAAALNGKAANPDADNYTDAYLDKLNDWIVYVDCKNLKHYLDYPTSGMKPITNMKIIYRIVPKNQQKDADPRPVRYEDLWYHLGVATGQKRYNRLGLPVDRLGCVIFNRTDDVYDQSRAVANVIVRMVLDIDLRNCVLTDVIVPKEMYDSVASDLGQFRFFARNELAGDAGQQLLIHLLSNPRGIDKYFLFDKGDNAAK